MRLLNLLPALAVGCVLATGTAFATTSHESHTSPYAGQAGQAIKSLSAQDIEDISLGRGWGLAKAAELNGLPGPRHVLDMAGELNLSGDQRAAIEAIFDRMQTRAVRLGARYLELETALDRDFSDSFVDIHDLEPRLEEIGKALGALRAVHLAAHLETVKVLDAQQVALYNRLRGYAGDLCDAQPSAGHPADMWRRHGGCT